MKFISSNFNSTLNFAITKDNEACVFGVGIPFKKLETSNQFVFADSGKRFQSMIDVDRLPVTWGDTKNGKLGIAYKQMSEELALQKFYSEKDREVL
jgi:hypothetical protein